MCELRRCNYKYPFSPPPGLRSPNYGTIAHSEYSEQRRLPGLFVSDRAAGPVGGSVRVFRAVAQQPQPPDRTARNSEPEASRAARSLSLAARARQASILRPLPGQPIFPSIPPFRPRPSQCFGLAASVAFFSDVRGARVAGCACGQRNLARAVAVRRHVDICKPSRGHALQLVARA